MLSDQLLSKINEKSIQLYQLSIEDLSLSFAAPFSSERNNIVHFGSNLYKLSFLSDIISQLNDYSYSQITLLKELQEQWKTFSYQTLKAIGVYKHLLSVNDLYKCLYPINIESKTFPLLTSRKLKLLHSVHSDSKGNYGTTDPELTSGQIYFESPLDEDCKLVLDVKLNKQIINCVSIDYSDLVAYEQPLLKSIYIDGLAVPFEIVNDDIILPPVIGNVMRLTWRQNKQWLNSLDSFVKLIAIESIEYKQNTYETSYSLEDKKQLSKALIGDLVLDINKLTDYDLLSIDGILNGFDLTTRLVNVKDIDLTMTVKTNDLINNLSSLLKTDPKYKNESYVVHRNGTEIALPLGKYIDNVFIYQYGLAVRSLKEYQYLFTGNGNEVYYEVPFNILDIQNATITVDGVTWTYTDDLHGAADNDKVWSFRNGRLMFGNDINGKAVPDKAVVQMKLEPVIVNASYKDNAYHIPFIEAFDPDIKNIYLGTISQNPISVNKFLPRNSLVFNLQPNIITLTAKALRKDGSVYAEPTLESEVSFIDGTTELVTEGNYSIDYNSGVLYLRSKIKDDEIVSISYSYYPVSEVKQDKELWVEDGIYKGVICKKIPTFKITDTVEGRKETIKFDTVEEYDITGDNDYVYSVKLSAPKIIKGTVKLDSVFASQATEVNYIDGMTELLNLKSVTLKTLAFSGTGVQALTLSYPSYLYQPLGVTFSNPNVFSTLMTEANDVISVGQYHIDYETGIVTFYIDGLVHPVNISYYLYNEITDLVYSIDYENGILYSLEDFILTGTISYETCNLMAGYHLVNPIPFRIENRTCWIHSSDIVNNSKEIKIVYQYDTMDNVTLMNYYSPVIKGIYIGIL